jgi:uncharacterized protein (DUF433 family)
MKARKSKPRAAREKRAPYKSNAPRKSKIISLPALRPKYPGGRWTTTRATDKIIETDHPYIHKVPGVGGGEPVIKGTRISVRDVVESWQLGWTFDVMLEAWPHIRLAQLCDALGYFDDHRDEILAYIEENKLVEVNDKTREH